MNIIKWIGILDGIVMAAAVALGNSVPAAQAYTNAIVEVGGTVATALASIAHIFPLKKP